MSWFIIDDHMAEHPTIRRLGLAALGLWVRMGSYVGMYADDDNYDGVFTLDDIKAYKGTKKLADSLVDAGLWEQVDGGYRIVYVDNICIKPRAKTKAENAELSEKRAESGRKGGKAKAANASKTAGKTSSKTSSKTAGKNLANDESEVWQNPSKTEPYTYTYTDTYTDMKPTHIPPDAEQATTATDAGTHDDPTTDAGPADAGEPAGADTTPADPDDDGNPDDGFAAAWNAYPRHDGSRREARRLWRTLTQGDQPAISRERLTASVLAFAKGHRDDARFVPAMGKWLRNGSWRDTAPRDKRGYEWGGISREWIAEHIEARVPPGAFGANAESAFWASVKTGEDPKHVADEIVEQINHQGRNQ